MREGTQNKLLRQDERDRRILPEQLGLRGQTCEQKSMQNGTDEPIYRKGMETENRLRTARKERAGRAEAVALTCTHCGV